MAAIKAAPNERTAQEISQSLWQLWATAPDAQSQELLDRGMTQRGAFDFLGAIETFDRLIAYCPDYAEGWNQRAFVSFLQQDYEPALRDLDQALALDPDHIAALSGKALTLFGLGRDDDGQRVLRQALDLNPWLGERALLRPVPGKDI